MAILLIIYKNRFLLLSFVLILLIGWGAIFIHHQDSKGTHKTLHQELLQMANNDQSVRREMNLADTEEMMPKLRNKIIAIDTQNTQRLKEIIQQYGWPTPAQIGKQGVSAAWLILQHTPDSTFRKAMRPILEAAYEKGDLEAHLFATFLDRIRTSQGKPQRYGTQFKIVQGNIELLPVENHDLLPSLRKKMGLPPLAEHLKQMRAYYRLQD